MATGDSKKSEPGNAIHEAPEQWWDAPIPGPHTAAYQIGRLLSQLNWHLQHVLILGCRGDRERMIDLILGQITAATIKLMPVPHGQFASAVTNVQEGWKDRLFSETVADEFNAIWQDREWERQEETIQEGLRKLVTAHVLSIVETLQTSISQMLPAEQCWALELGRCLDEGIRRADVFRFIDAGIVYREVATQSTESYPYDIEIHSVQQWRSLGPGDLDPHPSWVGKLRALAEQARVLTEAVVEILEPWKMYNPGTKVIGIWLAIESIDTSIREQLRAKDQIPRELSRYLTKNEIAKYHRGEQPGNSSAYVARLVKKGEITAPQGSGQQWRVYIDDFPEHVREQMRSSPLSKCAKS